MIEAQPVPGVYVLHFERPVGYGLTTGQAVNYGDGQHYVGQTRNIATRYTQHRKGWRGQAQGAAYVRYAGELGIDFYLAYVAHREDEPTRLELERNIQLDPRSVCLYCASGGPSGEDL